MIKIKNITLENFVEKITPRAIVDEDVRITIRFKGEYYTKGFGSELVFFYSSSGKGIIYRILYGKEDGDDLERDTKDPMSRAKKDLVYHLEKYPVDMRDVSERENLLEVDVCYEGKTIIEEMNNINAESRNGKSRALFAYLEHESSQEEFKDPVEHNEAREAWLENN